MSIPDQLLEQAMSLPQEERAELAGRLIDSLDPGAPGRESGSDEAWAAEIERRARAIDEGAVPLLGWEEVKARMQEALAEQRKSVAAPPGASA